MVTLSISLTSALILTGIAQIPIESMDGLCGPIAAYFALKEAGKSPSLTDLIPTEWRQDRGISVGELESILQKGGLQAKALDLQEVPDILASLPMIAVMKVPGHDAYHFLYVRSCSNDRLMTLDPIVGQGVIHLREFMETFSGIGIVYHQDYFFKIAKLRMVLSGLCVVGGLLSLARPLVRQFYLLCFIFASLGITAASASESTSVDLGTGIRGNVIKGRFYFEAPQEQKYIIKSKSCTCTVATLSTIQPENAKRQNYAIDIEVDTGKTKRTGRNVVSIVLQDLEESALQPKKALREFQFHYDVFFPFGLYRDNLAVGSIKDGETILIEEILSPQCTEMPTKILASEPWIWAVFVPAEKNDAPKLMIRLSPPSIKEGKSFEETVSLSNNDYEQTITLKGFCRSAAKASHEK